MLSYQYRKSHCGDETAARLSYLHNGISYNGNMASLYWNGARASEGMILTWFIQNALHSKNILHDSYCGVFVVWLCIILPISFMVASLALWQSSSCPSSSGAIWRIWVRYSYKSTKSYKAIKAKLSTAKLCLYPVEYTAIHLQYAALSNVLGQHSHCLFYQYKWVFRLVGLWENDVLT